MANSLLDAALSYVARGWYVLPLKTRGKQPIIPGGVLSASNDPEQVRKWWTDYPTANIGVACGKSGLVVVDVDPRNGGDPDWWRKEERAPSVETGGGGLHLYYTSEGVPEIRTSLEAGVDLQRGDKYVIVPPSIHPSGYDYRWLEDSSPFWLPLPKWIVEAAAVPTGVLLEAGRNRRNIAASTYDPDSPMDWYNRYGDLDQLLEDYGFELVETRSDGEKRWHRPGGDNIFQVTTNYKDTHALRSFSSETPFPQDETISAFRAYSILVHNGDDSEAARTIRTDLMQSKGTVYVQGVIEEKPCYHFEPAFEPSHWVGRYVEYASNKTDAAKEYHEAVALVMLACVTNGCRLRLAPFPDGLATNLYVALVGPSTRSRKSTAQQIGLGVLDQVEPNIRMANRISSEGAMYALQQRRGCAALWAPDEMGVALGEVYRREYLSALEELLLTLYGGTPYTYVTVSSNVTIDNVSMNVLGAATPESIALAGQRAALGGLLPRIGIVFPAALPDPKPVAGTGIGDSAVVEHLRAVFANASKHPPLTIDNSALVTLNEAEYPLTADKHTARLPVMLYKVAACSALAQMRSEIQASDADAAVKVIERWRQGSNRLQPYMRRNVGSLEFKHALDDVLALLRDLGPTVARPKLARELSMEKALLDRVRNTLVDQARIHITLATDETPEFWTYDGY